MTWNAAKAHCQGDGAQLASVRNEWSQAYVELMVMNLRAPLWIGLNKAEVQGRKPLKLHIANMTRLCL